MEFEVIRAGKLGVAFVALVTLFAVDLFLVMYQIPTSNEFGRALVAADLLHRRQINVRIHVHAQSSFGLEGLGTLIALDGPLLGMNEHVLLQVGVVLEGSRAMRALENPR